MKVRNWFQSLFRKPADQDWFIPDDYIEMLTEAEAKFIFDHAEKQLKDTLDTNAAITSKTTTLVTLIVGLLAALFSFEINRWDKNHSFDPLLDSAIFGCCYLFFVAIILSFIIHPKQYYILGSEPTDFFQGEFFTQEIGKNRLKFIYINEIENYYQRITANKRVNKRRALFYKISLYMTVCSPLVFIIFYLLRFRYT